MHFSFSKIFIVSRLILGPTLSISLFPYFSLFSCYISAYTVFVSHFPRFSGFFSFFFFLQFSLYILHFFTFFIFLTIFQVLQCAFFIFHVFKWVFFFFFCHIPGPRVSVSHYSGFFSVSRQIPDHTVFVSHFPLFSVFLTYSRSYSVRFSFFTFLEVPPPQGPSPRMCVTIFPRFSVFSP